MNRTQLCVLAGLLLATVFAKLPAAAQTGGVTNVSPAGAGGSSGGVTVPAPSTGTGVRSPGQTVSPTPTNKSNGDLSRPIYVSGRVVLDDGSPIPQSVTVQRVCSGLTRTVAYADSRGRFSFQWGQTSGVVADASDSGGFTMRNSAGGGGIGSAQSAGGENIFSGDPYSNNMSNCELRASLGGYTSDSVNMFNRNSLDSSEVGMIVLHRIAGVEGSSISASSLLAPKDAKKSYDRGLQSLLKNKPDEAAKDFEKAVAVYPNYADAWMNLGKVRLQQKDTEQARTAMLKAVDADPKLVPPYLELGILSAQAKNWQESAQYLDRAVKLDPVDYPQAWYTSAVANFNLKKYSEAEQRVRQAIKLDPNHVNPRAQYLLGLVLEEKQDYAGASAEMTAYLKYSPNAVDLIQVQEEVRKLEKIIGEAKQAAKYQ